jgi:hypothetical protein
MSEDAEQYIAMTPGFEKPAVGDVVKVEAVDWGLVDEQTRPNDLVHRIVRGTIYGQIIICTDEQITLAPQVFDDGSVRCALTMPWVTVLRVTILEHTQ